MIKIITGFPMHHTIKINNRTFLLAPYAEVHRFWQPLLHLWININYLKSMLTLIKFNIWCEKCALTPLIFLIFRRQGIMGSNVWYKTFWYFFLGYQNYFLEIIWFSVNIRHINFCMCDWYFEYYYLNLKFSLLNVFCEALQWKG